jgi:hypothetical protein
VNTLHTPNDIEVLLHHHYSPDPHPRRDAPAVMGSINKFRRAGIFTDQVQPTLTEKGTAWVNMICNTPYPRQVYVDQNNNVIEQ